MALAEQTLRLAHRATQRFVKGYIGLEKRPARFYTLRLLHKAISRPVKGYIGLHRDLQSLMYVLQTLGPETQAPGDLQD